MTKVKSSDMHVVCNLILHIAIPGQVYVCVTSRLVIKFIKSFPLEKRLHVFTYYFVMRLSNYCIEEYFHQVKFYQFLQSVEASKNFAGEFDNSSFCKVNQDSTKSSSKSLPLHVVLIYLIPFIMSVLHLCCEPSQR